MNDTIAQQIAEAVARRLHSSDPQVREIVAQELQSVLQGAPGTLPPPTEPSGSPQGGAPSPVASPTETSRVVVTAHGRNRSGIVARLASAIDEFQGDIRDLNQTIVADYFTMLFVVDLQDTGPGAARFVQLRARLQEIGKDLGVHVVVMHDDILSSMHSI